MGHLLANFDFKEENYFKCTKYCKKETVAWLQSQTRLAAKEAAAKEYKGGKIPAFLLYSGPFSMFQRDLYQGG